MKPLHARVLSSVTAMVMAITSQAAPAGKPNIIVLLSDDAGYHEFSMHGSKTIPTPRIDSIAAMCAKMWGRGGEGAS